MVFRPASAVLWNLPHVISTRRGTIPFWDVHAGGGAYRVDITRK
jgi:hypothetical protein